MADGIFIILNLHTHQNQRSSSTPACSHWGDAPPTAAMGRSTVVGVEVGSNDRLALQAIYGLCLLPAFGAINVQRQVTDLDLTGRTEKSSRNSRSMHSGYYINPVNALDAY
jgi:hypothetical protein